MGWTALRTASDGAPHHVTQRGIRREHVFFSEDDYARQADLADLLGTSLTADVRRT